MKKPRFQILRALIVGRNECTSSDAELQYGWSSMNYSAFLGDLLIQPEERLPLSCEQTRELSRHCKCANLQK